MHASCIVGASMMRIAVIGFGYWGPNIVRNLALLPHVSVSWVCDVNPRVLAAIPRMYPTVRTTKNIDDVLADSKTHAVIIVTPPSTHFPLAQKAILAGKHVLVEKPMTASAQDALKLTTLADREKKVLMVDHTFLYTPAVRKLKEILDRGTLGRVIYVDSVRTNLGLFQKDSNVVADLAVHDFSIMQYLFGKTPTKISATGLAQEDLHQETVAHITATYDQSLFLHSHVSWLSPIKIRRMIFVGTKKMVVYDDMEPSEKIKIYDKSVSVTSDPKEAYALRVGYRSGTAVVPKLGVGEALFGVVSEFTRTIRTGKRPQADGNQGLLVVRCIEAATKSLRHEGKPVAVVARDRSKKL